MKELSLKEFKRGNRNETSVMNLLHLTSEPHSPGSG